MRMRATTFRRSAAAAVPGMLAVLVILSGCSKVMGSKASTSGRPAACTFVAKLDAIANSVAKANVGDPDAFNKTMQTAVAQYVTNVRGLRAVAPADLSLSLTRVEADVQQLRFDAAATDRAALDAYAARSCGRVTVSASSSTAPTALATAPVSATTSPAGPTTTTTPSDG